MNLFPQTTTTREIQKSYRTVFDKAKKSGPVIVMTNNKPDIALIAVPQLEELYKKSRATELRQAMQAIKEYGKEKKLGLLKPFNSLRELM